MSKTYVSHTFKSGYACDARMNRWTEEIGYFRPTSDRESERWAEYAVVSTVGALAGEIVGMINMEGWSAEGVPIYRTYVRDEDWDGWKLLPALYSTRPAAARAALL